MVEGGIEMVVMVVVGVVEVTNLVGEEALLRAGLAG